MTPSSSTDHCHRRRRRHRRRWLRPYCSVEHPAAVAAILAHRFRRRGGNLRETGSLCPLFLVWAALCRAHAKRMLLGAYNPMLCPFESMQARRSNSSSTGTAPSYSFRACHPAPPVLLLLLHLFPLSPPSFLLLFFLLAHHQPCSSPSTRTLLFWPPPPPSFSPALSRSLSLSFSLALSLALNVSLLPPPPPPLHSPHAISRSESGTDSLPRDVRPAPAPSPRVPPVPHPPAMAMQPFPPPSHRWPQIFVHVRRDRVNCGQQSD